MTPRLFFAAAVALGGAAACELNEALPDGARITCSDDADCPNDLACRDGLCSAGAAPNTAPRLDVSAPIPAGGGRFLDTVDVRFHVSDGNSADTCAVHVTMILDDDGSGTERVIHDPTPVGGAPLELFACDPAGKDGVFSWDAVADLSDHVRLVDADGDGVAEEGPIVDAVPRFHAELTATDAGGLVSPTVLSPGATLGNAPPEITAVIVDPEVRGDRVPLEITVRDAAPLDLADLEITLRVVGAAADPPAPAAVVLGETEQLATSEEGQTYVVVIDTLAAGVGVIDADVDVTVRAVDHPQPGVSHTGPATTVRTHVRNQTPPEVAAVYAKLTGGLANGAVPITYRLVDEQGDAADILVEVSRDFGATFTAASEATTFRSEGSEGLATAPANAADGGGVLHTFVWDSTADLFAPSSSTIVRITARDAGAGAGAPVEVLAQVPAGPPVADIVAATFPRRIDVERDALAQIEPTVAVLAPVNADDDIPDVVVAGFTPGGITAPTIAIGVNLANGAAGVGRAGFNGTFGAQVFAQSVITTDAVDIDTGDVDCDGAREIALVSAAADAQPAQLALLHLDAGNTGLQLIDAVALPATTAAPGRVRVADLDKDGNPDIVVGGDDGLAVWFGGACSIDIALAPVIVDAGGDARAFSLGDVSGDGQLDIAVADALLVQSAAAPRAFDRRAYGAGLTGDPALGDVDGDGDDDVALLGPAGAFLENVGAGALVAAGGAFASGDGLVERPISSDVTGDGVADLLVTARASASATAQARVLRGDGAGGFAPVLDVPLDAAVAHVSAADVDGDGFLDLVGGNADGVRDNVVVVTSGPAPLPGATSFAPPIVLPLGAHDVSGLAAVAPMCAAAPIGDLDEDGALDLLSGAADGVDVAAYGRLSGRAPIGVFDGARLDDGAAPVAQAMSLAVGDVDSDGRVDLLGGDLAVDVLGVRGVDVIHVNLAVLGGRSLGGDDGNEVALDGVARCASLSDMDGDGDLDVAAVVRTAAGPVRFDVYENDGAGVFTRDDGDGAVLPGAGEGGACDVADLDDDGVPDVVAAGDGKVFVFLRGAGDLSAPSQTIDLGAGARDVPALRLLDADGDGVLDLVDVEWITSGLSSADRVELRLGIGAGAGTSGLGTGAFEAAARELLPPVVDRLRALEAGDLNDDGVVDLVTVGAAGGGSVYVMFGDPAAAALGASPFATPVQLASNAGDAVVGALADLDGDGLADIALNTANGAWTLLGTRRLDPRAAWARRVGALSSRGLVGGDDEGDHDLFGRGAAGAFFSVRRSFGARDDGPGDLRRADVALRPSFVDEVRAAGVVPAGVGLRPLARPLRVGGDLVIVRSDAPDGGTRLEVRDRYGARTAPGARDDFRRAGLSIAGGRAVIVRVPLDVPLAAAEAADAFVVGVLRVSDWARADEDPRDPLGADAAEAHRYLPRVDGRDVVRERVHYELVTAGNVRDPDASLCDGADVHACLETVGDAGDAVDVALDRFGVLQLFVASARFF